MVLFLLGVIGMPKCKHVWEGEGRMRSCVKGCGVFKKYYTCPGGNKYMVYMRAVNEEGLDVDGNTCISSMSLLTLEPYYARRVR